MIKVKIYPSEEGGFWAEALSMPGCVTEGDTIETIKPRIHEAIEAWLSEPVSSGDIEIDIPVTNLPE